MMKIKQQNTSFNEKKSKGGNESNKSQDITSTKIQKDNKQHNDNEEEQTSNNNRPHTQQRLHGNEDEDQKNFNRSKKTDSTFGPDNIDDPVTAIDNCIPLKVMLIICS